MTWRARVRTLGLLFCGAVGAYLLQVIVLSPLMVAMARWLRGVESVGLRLLVGVLLIDGGKLLGLLPAAFLLGRGSAFAPFTAAVLLVTLLLLLEAAVALVLGQTGWLYGSAALLALRGAMLVLVSWAVAAVLRRRHVYTEPRSNPSEDEGKPG